MTPRKTLYVRVEPDIHERILAYASTYNFAVNDVVVSLLEQLLVQVDPSFPVPEHLCRFFRRPAHGPSLRG
jgi:hypothetical protein